jgi:hypothetical protein
MIDLIKGNEFSFWLPMDLCKAENKRGDQGKRRWIEGIASTEHQDLQDETVSQHGIDFTYFLEHGYYNNDHKPGFENKVGQPIEAKITPQGLWTKGYLFENHKVADAIWELAHALEASRSDRKLGFSIQGKVLRREGRRILKCWVQDIAITAAPINTHTWLDVVKSLSAVPVEMWCEGESGVIYPTDTAKSIPCSGTCKKACKSCRSLSETQMDLKKDREEDEEKALGTSGTGRALIPQSLEGDKKVLTYKSLSRDECVQLLQERRGFSRSEALVLTEAVMQMNGIVN